jgi:hypothetical protein
MEEGFGIFPDHVHPRVPRWPAFILISIQDLD